VQHTLEHIVAFAWVRDAQLPELSALMSPVGKGAAPERAGQDVSTR
jgi:hypothetical protein